MESAFQDWWRVFSSKKDRDVYYASELLQEHVHSMPDDERSAFVVHLARVVCRREGLYGAATPVLESFANEEARRELFSCLQKLKRTDPVSDGQEATIIRILALSAPEAYRDLVETYLFVRPVALNYSMVLWTLWPKEPVLFGKAFVRQIAHLSPERLRGTIVFAGFYSKPEPLAAVRSAFEMAGEVGLWKRTCASIRATQMPGATAAQRAAVERLLE